jgi:IMP dehydrogenase
MQFLRPENEHKELTYNDVFLMPRCSDVASRMDVDLATHDPLKLTIPIVVANMTAVAGKRMAETLTRRGGLVVLTQDMSTERIEEIIGYVKQRHHVFETPVVLSENESVQTALNLIYKRAHGAVIVVDTAHKPVGIFTEKDAHRRDHYNRLGEVMTRQPISVASTMSSQEIFAFLHERRLNIVPVVNNDGTLAGVMSKKGCVRATIYKPALNRQGELKTCVAVRIREGLEQNIEQLQVLGVDVFCLDTAHGHQSRMIDAIKRARAILGPDIPLIAGNIVTAQAAEDFISAGASVLKVGVGPGGACKTRMTTGVGRPQFSAVHRVAQVARRHENIGVIADGGIKHPRDVALAIAAGATSTMIGTWFAGTYESPADVQIDEQGQLYKEQFGMASQRAVENRNRVVDPFKQAQKEFFEEGVSQSKMYLKPHQESVEDIIDEVSSGLRSACTYMGARNLEQFFENAIVGVQTDAGYTEGKPVSQSW